MDVRIDACPMDFYILYKGNEKQETIIRNNIRNSEVQLPEITSEMPIQINISSDDSSSGESPDQHRDSDSNEDSLDFENNVQTKQPNSNSIQIQSFMTVSMNDFQNFEDVSNSKIKFMSHLNEVREAFVTNSCNGQNDAETESNNPDLLMDYSSSSEELPEHLKDDWVPPPSQITNFKDAFIQNNKNIEEVPKPCRARVRKLFKCPYCVYSSDKHHCAENHIKKRHFENGIRKFTCALVGCKYETKKRTKLVKHKNSHVKLSQNDGPPLSYECPVINCTYETKNWKCLINHTEFCHEKSFIADGDSYKCDVSSCYYFANSLKVLKKHQKTCHDFGTTSLVNINNNNNKCAEIGCDYIAKSSKGLNTHILRHRLEYVFKCEQCGYLAVNKAKLKRHVQRQHAKTKKNKQQPKLAAEASTKAACLTNSDSDRNSNINNDTFSCELCEFSTMSEVYFHQHQQWMHYINVKHICPNCQYSTNSETSMKEHMYVHTGGYPYQCQRCNYKTSLETRYFEHIAWHTNLYQCKYCEMKFENIFDQSQHTAMYHQICGLCKVRFRTLSDAVQHKSIHNTRCYVLLRRLKRV